MRYRVKFASSARRAIEVTLPEDVAAAVYEFIVGPLADNPRRLGKPLVNDLAGRWVARRGDYRVVFRLDDDIVTITVIRVGHRRHIYRG